MTFKEAVKFTILECEIPIFDATVHASNKPVNEDDEFPVNIWHLMMWVATRSHTT